ncbi:MAG: hypothetical protein WAX77_15305 [Methylococcaceae bacterium]
MKKIAYLLLVLLGLFGSTAVLAKTPPMPETRHALEISIGGTGVGVDAVAYKTLRQLIGKAVANNVIDKFIVLGYGREGGFSACVEDRPSTQPPSKTFERFVKQISALAYNPNTTFYSVTRLTTCPPLIAKPTTVLVAKSDGGLQCENNSGISVADMQTQLGDITVYSADKESDGLIHPALCGIDAGNFNVYEIAETDLDKAIALGFIEWIKPINP